ncbi:MAG: fatty acid metabolism transcriptional regulator FadR [Vibrionaceae bacterium]
MVIKADSPAAFAEKYIIKSIWNNHFPQGSILPAERELSEQIGVTRTTLREVLQRLARDGWLTIQHGKPTRINDYMNTAGLSILDTLVTLEGEDVHGVLEDLLAARTDISCIYMRHAIKNNAQACRQLITKVIFSCEKLVENKKFEIAISELAERDAILQDTKKITETFKDASPSLTEAICFGRAFNYFDYLLFQGMAQFSNSKVYLLTINGMRKIYSRVGGYYFMNGNACELALNFYKELLDIIDQQKYHKTKNILKKYGRESGMIWLSQKEHISELMAQEEAL